MKKITYEMCLKAWKNTQLGNDEISKQADEMIKKAIEKQIPKRPDSEYDDECICPECGETIEEYDVTKIKYCPECGQAWRWEDESCDTKEC